MHLFPDTASVFLYRHMPTNMKTTNKYKTYINAGSTTKLGSKTYFGAIINMASSIKTYLLLAVKVAAYQLLN